MVELSSFVRLFHILSAFALIAGLIGRQITRAQAAKATDIHIFNSLIQLSGRFESLLVIPASMLILLFGLLVALMRGWPLLGFLQGASTN